VKNGGKTVVDHATSRHVDRRYHQHVLAQRAGREQTTGERRPQLAAAPSERKQPGRRYGPPPKSTPHPRMQAPAPMDPGKRMAAYIRDRLPTALGFTVRQERQLGRFSDRQAVTEGLVPRQGKKDHATAKRGTSR
jgi:hypothetical protein